MLERGSVLSVLEEDCNRCGMGLNFIDLDPTTPYPIITLSGTPMRVLFFNEGLCSVYLDITGDRLIGITTAGVIDGPIHWADIRVLWAGCRHPNQAYEPEYNNIVARVKESMMSNKDVVSYQHRESINEAITDIHLIMSLMGIRTAETKSAGTVSTLVKRV